MDLVFLHGVPGAGKLTVARALGERLHYGVFHNRLIVDALTAVFPFGSVPFVELREPFWLATFGRAATDGASLIFTFSPEATVSAGFPERVRDTVGERGGRVVFVELTVGEAEQERRVALPSRREFGKLADVETLRRLRAAARTPGAVERPPSDLRIDTEACAPDRAAATILEHFDLAAAPSRVTYPEPGF